MVTQRYSRWRGFKKLLGVGPHLIVLGLLIEALTLFIQRWLSFPFALALGMQILMTFLCVALSLSGLIWFNRTINLVEVNLRGGKNELVTHGPFNYVRHPLYATLLIGVPPLTIIWFADLLFFAPWALIFILAYRVISREERGLIETFGQEYQRYRRYVPALLPYKGAGGRRYREHRAELLPGKIDD